MKKTSKERIFEVTARLDKTFKPKMNEELLPGENPLNEVQTRPLYEIAQEIYRDWRPVSPYAKPYLEAMSSLNSINDRYMFDSGDMIVRYFLSNASTWRGETAKRIKAELKAMLGMKENVNFSENPGAPPGDIPPLPAVKPQLSATEPTSPIVNEGSGLGTPINKWVYFSFNYPSGFIEKVWADDPNIVQHLNEKFGAYYDKVGAVGVMNKFYVELDSENQKKLEDWVLANYKG
jgi:hypothetical protein